MDIVQNIVNTQRQGASSWRPATAAELVREAGREKRQKRNQGDTASSSAPAQFGQGVIRPVAGSSGVKYKNAGKRPVEAV